MRKGNPLELDQLEFHKESITVATCQKAHCKIRRTVLELKPTYCPKCHGVLFYERVLKTKVPHYNKGGVIYEPRKRKRIRQPES